MIPSSPVYRRGAGAAGSHTVVADRVVHEPAGLPHGRAVLGVDGVALAPLGHIAVAATQVVEPHALLRDRCAVRAAVGHERHAYLAAGRAIPATRLAALAPARHVALAGAAGIHALARIRS